MNRSLIAVVIVTAGLIVCGYVYREQLTSAAMAKLTEDMFVMEDSDSFDPGPAVGSRFPGLRALHRGKQITLLDDFAGDNGTLLIASRSIEWCPYCIRQLLQLQNHLEDFEDAGIGLLAITYDRPGVQEAFSAEFGITIPLASDINALSFKTLGILNPDYGPDEIEYGIPYPGMIVVDPQGIVAGKLFLESYDTRIHAGAALNYAKQALALGN
ncbi:MAG: redoxin domain-containing protein [Pseudomonadota bacterium]